MPAALPAIAAVAAVAGAGVGTYAAIQQGQAQREAARFNRKVAENNSLQAANEALIAQRQTRRRNLLRLGTARAVASKNSTEIGGSAYDVIYDTSIQGELAALADIYSGSTKVSGYQSAARMASFEGRQASRASLLSATGTAIGGVSQGAFYLNQTK